MRIKQFVGTLLLALALHQPAFAGEVAQASSNQTLLDLLGQPILEGPKTVSTISFKVVECAKRIANVEPDFFKGGEAFGEEYIARCKARIAQMIGNDARNTGGYVLEDFDAVEMYTKVVAASDAAFSIYRALLTSDEFSQYHMVFYDFWTDGPEIG